MTLEVHLRTSTGRHSVLLALSDSLRQRLGVHNTNQALILIGAWLSLLSDSPMTGELKPLGAYLRFSRKLCEDLPSVISSCSELADQLLAAKDITVLYRRFMKLPIFKEFHSFVKSDNAQLLQYILSFLTFGKKCEFDIEEFNSAALRSWERIEEDLSFTEDSITQNLRCIISALLPLRIPTFLGGKNGSGAVAGPERGDLEKAEAFRMSPKLRFLFSKSSPLSSADQASLSFIMDMLSEQDYAMLTTSELMFVPKNYRTARSICKEPGSVMFAQQLVREIVEAAIRESPLVRIIRISDQTWNQQGAIAGSRWGSVDTIDLSAASDSVHVDLIKSIFPKPYIKLMLATRTHLVRKPGGQVVRIKKFAPMGSAMCFPTQSIVYAAIVILAYIHIKYGHPEDGDLDLKHFDVEWFMNSHVSRLFDNCDKTFEAIAVYGDDIICDSNATNVVVSILSRLGFKVNSSKSFTGSQPVRESCGVYAYKGHVVTPYQFKLKQVRNGFDAKSLPSMIALCNLAGDYKYRNLHSYLIHMLLNFGRVGKGYNPIAFSSIDNTSSEFIYTKSVSNRHLKRRYNKDLQRDEYRTWSVQPEKVVHAKDVSSPKWDAYAYHMWNRANLSGESRSENFVTPRAVRKGTAIRWGWTPAYLSP